MKDKIIAKLKELNEMSREHANINDRDILKLFDKLESELAELEQKPTAIERVREAFEPIQLEQESKGGTDLHPVDLEQIMEDYPVYDKEHSEKMGEKIQPSVENCAIECNGPDCEGCRDFKPIEPQPNKEAEEWFYKRYTFIKEPNDRIMMYPSEIFELLQEYAEAYSKKNRGEEDVTDIKKAFRITGKECY